MPVFRRVNEAVLKHAGQVADNSSKNGGENSHNSHINGHDSTFVGRWIPHQPVVDCAAVGRV